ncbi:hypothetical protein ACRE7B_27955, partial [Klebsiella pneumoniae]
RPLNKTKGCLIANFATVPYIYLLRDDIFISKMLQIHHHETDHRKQVTRLGIPFRPEHPYDTHARLLLL